MASHTSWGLVNENNYDKKLEETKKYGPLRLSMAAEMRKIFDQLELVWFLDCGSLMGAYRNGKMIPHDDDFDFGILISEEEFDKLPEKIGKLLPPEFKVRMTDTYCKKLEVYDERYGNYIFDEEKKYDYYNRSNDIQLYCPSKDNQEDFKIMYFKNNFSDTCHFKRAMVEPRGEIEFEGVTFKCPGDPKRYLEEMYGYIGEGARFNFEKQKYEKKPEHQKKEEENKA